MTAFTFEYQPIPVHYPFHQCTSYEAVAFGGYGSGKSFALCAEAIALGLEQPGSEILICRRTVPSLRDTTEAIFVGLLPPKFFDSCVVKRMGGHYESITFPNGTKYMFRGLDDWMKLKSLSLAAIFFDEVDELDEETYMGMLSRVRQTRPTAAARAQGAADITRRYIRSASNPAGHNWVWKRFVGPDRQPQTAFFVSTSLDNPHLPMDYIDALLAMPDPWVRRYVLCGFDDFAGQIYESWTWDTHVIQPYMANSFDPTSFVLMGMDPGTSKENPTAGLWCYYDKDKHWLVGVAEYQAHSLNAKTHAMQWRTIESRFGRTRVRQRIADPTVTTRDRGSNMKLSDQYLRAGFNFELGPRLNKDRIPMLGQLIEDGRFRVTTDCPQTFEAIQNYKWKDLTPQQRQNGADQSPVKKDDHLVNCAQYVTSKYVPPPAIVPMEEPLPGDTVEEQLRAEHQAEIRKAIREQLASKTATRAHDLGMMPV